MFGGFTLRHIPCADCGASVAKTELDEHVCDRERRVDYDLFQLRDDLARLEEEYRAFLASPAGKFALWQARRTRGA